MLFEKKREDKKAKIPNFCVYLLKISCMHHIKANKKIHKVSCQMNQIVVWLLYHKNLPSYSD